MSTGEYIGFIDGDDHIYSNMFETMLEILEKTDGDIVQCGFTIHTKNHNDTYGNTSSMFIYTSREALMQLYGEHQDKELNFFVWNKIYRRSLFKDISFSKDRLNEDVIIMPKLFFYSKKIVVNNIPLVNYVVRDDSIMDIQKKDRSKMILSHLIAYNEASLFFKNRDIQFYEISLKYTLSFAISALINTTLRKQNRQCIFSILKSHPYWKNKYVPLKKKVVLLLYSFIYRNIKG
jgi:hypothetical protein